MIRDGFWVVMAATLVGLILFVNEVMATPHGNKMWGRIGVLWLVIGCVAAFWELYLAWKEAKT
jgi:hypothetical protein